MLIQAITARYILVGCDEDEDLLAGGAHRFTHTASAYGERKLKTATGEGETMTLAKINAPALLDKILSQMATEDRKQVRCFIGGGVDPYGDAEREFRLTRDLLKVFAKYDDLDLLVIQTSSGFAAADLEIMKTIPYLWLSAEIDTSANFEPMIYVINEAAERGIKTVVAVKTIAEFDKKLYVSIASDLRNCNWERAVIIPSGSPLVATWLFKNMKCTSGRSISWGMSGMCDIKPRWSEPIPHIVQLALFGFSLEAV